MTLEEAKAYALLKLEQGNKSDGCTSWLAPKGNHVECCKMHDMLRRFGPVSRFEANRHLRTCMIEKKRPILAWIYWIFTTITLPLFKN